MKYHFCKIFFLLLLVFGGCTTKSTLAPSDIIDEKSLLVLEVPRIDSVGSFYQNFQANPIAINFFKKLPGQILVSLQPINSSEHSLLFLKGMVKDEFDRLMEGKNDKSSKIIQRNYNGIAITEISPVSGAKVSVAFINGVACLSESALLIENCIRISLDPTRQKFKSRVGRLTGFTMVKDDNGNVFIRNEGILSLFKFPSWIEKSNQFYQSGLLSLLDIKQAGNDHLLNGFSVEDSVAMEGIRYFKNQQAVPVQLTRYVPNSARYFFHFGISDYNQWKKEGQSALKDSFLSTLGDEIILFNTRQDKPGIILEISDKINLTNSLKEIESSSQYFESYSGSEIRRMQGNNSITEFLSKFIELDSVLYSSMKDNALIITSSVDDLKFSLESIDRDETWGKSLSFQDFFGKSLQESNFSLIAKDLKLQVKKSAGLNQLLESFGFRNLQWLSIQHSSLDDHFYTNINIVESENKQVETPSKIREIQFESTIKSINPLVNGKSINLLIENSNQLHSLEVTGKKLWTSDLESEIKNPIQLIDFNKNGRNQFLVTTKQKLHILDRQGKNISGYPLTLPVSPEFGNVIDYDKSKNYRFLIAGEQMIYLFDKQRKSLDGWNPRKFTQPFQFAPEHYRIGGKDYFFTILTDGSIHLINRRGDYVKNFPVALNIRTAGNFYLDKGSSLSNCYLNLVTQEGVIHRVSLGDQRVEKIEMVRSKDSDFQLVSIDNSSSFQILRIDPITIAVFNAKGELIFEVPNPGSEGLTAEIIKQKDGSMIYCLYDQAQKLTYLYSQDGSSHAQSPIESSLPIQWYTDPVSEVIFLCAARDKTLSLIPLR